jgi:hypothetical protein
LCVYIVAHGHGICIIRAITKEIDMKVNVFQFNLTDVEREEVNNIGWEATDRISKWGDKRLLQIAGDEAVAEFAATNFDEYELVVTVEVPDTDEWKALELAYGAMNQWDNPESITRYRMCASMSIGDICEINGQLFVCATFGFDKFSLGEAA